MDTKTSAIMEFKTPRTKKDVRSFLGLAGYYRRFVPNFSSIAAPLTDLTCKDLPDKVRWTDHHQQAFSTLKTILTSAPVLQGPDYAKEFVIQTDALDVGIGAVLAQTDNQGNDRPVAFFSRKLKSRERNYAAVERECLAVVEAVKHF